MAAGSSSSCRFACCCLLLVAALLASMAPCSRAQNSAKDFVDLINAARADVGVGPVVWNETVAAYAQAYAEQRRGDCSLKLSPSDIYGETIFTGTGSTTYTAADAVRLWLSGKQWYNHGNNSCSAPAGRSCGSYTQVVWRDSTNIGCARVVCRNNVGVFINCNYSPAGNIICESPY